MGNQRINPTKMRKLQNDYEPVNMNELVPKLLAFPPDPTPTQPLKPEEYDHHIRTIKKLLDDTPSETLALSRDDGSTLLDVFDPVKNSLSYAYVLVSLCQANQGKGRNIVPLLQPNGALWQYLVNFLGSFDPVQMRYAGLQYQLFVEIIYRGAYETGQYQLGITHLRTAILRLDPSAETFTSAHRMFAHLSLIARSYNDALPILDKDIYHFPAMANPAFKNKLPPPCANHEFSSAYITAASGHSKKLTHRMVLEYYIYSAMIYMALTDWERALFFLEACITMPTQNTASMIQVEAYRKYLLVGLIHKGVVLQMPKGTNVQAARGIRYLSRHYEAVADVFKSGTQDRLRAEIEVAGTLWQAHNNYSLIIQVFNSFRKYALIRLSSTYAALSIPKIMTLIPPSPMHGSNATETETYIASLIASGSLSGTLIPGSTPSESAILRFNSSNSNGAAVDYENQIEKMLAERTAEITSIAKHMRAVGETLEMSKEYVDWLKKTKKSEGKNRAAKDTVTAAAGDFSTMGGGGMDMPGRFMEDDEDVMADL